MIKRTLHFGNPAYLKTKNEQLIVEILDTGETKSVPIEDIGIVILDHQQITITQAVMAKLLENNTALITCNQKHHPIGLQLCLDGHTLQSQKFKVQIAASIPLKKQLWQQTVAAKIRNQAALLSAEGAESKYLVKLADTVKSADSTNNEAKAALYYWKHIFPDFLQFTRDPEGVPPNNLLNYGYAIIRAIVARSLVASGLLPTLGIFHRNQYNAYCLADDIMEPFRPFADQVVCKIVRMNGKFLEMTPSMKTDLLSIAAMDVMIDGQKSPLMNAAQRTTASLAKCFEGSTRKILYPIME
jgi:CRISPR-associated protein Cas1